jgi:hypothetical protein
MTWEKMNLRERANFVVSFDPEEACCADWWSNIVRISDGIARTDLEKPVARFRFCPWCASKLPPAQ